MPLALHIEQFLNQSKGKKVIDVRSPAEFSQGHIPGAVNVALFSNDERAIIGTIYKQRNRQEAVMKGLELVAPRLTDLVQQCKDFGADNEIFIHCWRGGMRSGFVAMLLEMYGFKVHTLKGGYKSYRTFALESFSQSRNIQILGGRTGSGKTKILEALKLRGENVIDLEKIAHHKGSAFGALGEMPQPTQEQFENELAYQLFFIPPASMIWVEDESRMIGKKVIPEGLWLQMRETATLYLDLPFDERLNYIVREYGKFDLEGIKDSIQRISKRLGPEQTKNALLAINNGDIKSAFYYCLHYYDKTYTHGLSTRNAERVTTISFNQMDFELIADTLLSNLKAHERS